MSNTAVLSGLELTKWMREFNTEYIRATKFKAMMGEGTDSVIHVINDLKDTGYTIRVPFVTRLQGNGVTGNEDLSGSEEEIGQFYQDISWDYKRNAVRFTKKEIEKSANNLVEVAKPLLKNWASELVKYEIIDSLHKMTSTVKFSAASATDRNAWTVNNVDRVLFGAAASNYNATHATALANVDNTSDKLTPELISLARLMARTANPHIRPYQLEDGREIYVMLAHPLAFRDLKANTTMATANREARPRSTDNPIFQDGDLLWDGVVIKEIPEFYQPRVGATTTPNPETTFSNGTIVCAANFLLGAQAIGFVQKQLAKPTVKTETDYGYITGHGVELAHGIDKLRWGGNTARNVAADVGVFTVYTAAVA
jgi:hypothetical protein